MAGVFSKSRLSGEGKRALRRLRFGLLLFFFCLLVPSAYLANRAYNQLEVESFLRLRTQAEDWFDAMDQELANTLAREDARAFEDYRFLDVKTGKPSLSPLSSLRFIRSPSAPTGVIGFFQVDPDGSYTSPLLPAGENFKGHKLEQGIDRGELAERRRRVDLIYDLVKDHKVVAGNMSQRKILWNAYTSFFDARKQKEAEDSYVSYKKNLSSELFSNSRRNRSVKEPAVQKEQNKELAKANIMAQLKVSDLKLDQRYEQQVESLQLSNAVPTFTQRYRSRGKRKKRVEVMREVEKKKNVAKKDDFTDTVEADDIAGGASSSWSGVQALKKTTKSKQRVTSFLGEIDPFQMRALSPQHWMFFRKVWRDKQPYVQGFVIDARRFLSQTIEQRFQVSPLAATASLVIAHQGDILTNIGGYQSSFKREILLFKNSLSPPFSNVECLLSLKQLPKVMQSPVLNLAVGLFAFVLLVGTAGLYYIGSTQISLVGQRNDFVSAVSHELKTPLTSIRMYGEMLRSGWVNEEKKKGYYDFIFYESERLSRLINNVLRLSRIGRGEERMELKSMSLSSLLDQLRSKLSSQVEASGFKLEIQSEEELADISIDVEEDAFLQIFINLVDNAVKFSSESEDKRVLVSLVVQNQRAIFSVRDFGPGISASQRKKIFEMFYRCENEMTRQTSGTGIGLALVNELAQQMHAQVDLGQPEMGAEFRVSFEVV